MKTKLTGYIVDNSFGKWLDDYEEDNITPNKVADAVAKANELGEPLEVEFSSMGGSVSSAGEICAELTKVKHGTVGLLSGLIASAGSTIACAFDTAKMYDYSELMIHNPRINAGWGMTIRPQEAKEIADMLETSTNSLVNIYCQKTGLPEDEIRGYLDAEKFFTANEAKELGFVDEVIPIVSNSAGSMPKISYKDAVENADEKFSNLFNRYKGAPMPNENELVKNNVVDKPATAESEATPTESVTEDEPVAVEEPTMNAVLSAITALTDTVSKLVGNSEPAQTTDVVKKPAVVADEAKPVVEDVFVIDKAGKEKTNTVTPKVNSFGLDQSDVNYVI